MVSRKGVQVASPGGSGIAIAISIPDGGDRAPEIVGVLGVPKSDS
jgi:L-asparaginase II